MPGDMEKEAESRSPSTGLAPDAGQDGVSDHVHTEAAAVRALRDSESHSDSTPTNTKNNSTVQESVEGAWKGGEPWKDGEIWTGGEVQDKETLQKEGEEAQNEGVWKKMNETVASLAGKEAIFEDIPLPQTDLNTVKELAGVTETLSTEFFAEVRSQSSKTLSCPQSPGGKPHRPRSPRSRSPSQGRRTWLQERSSTHDSQRESQSSHTSHSSDSSSSSEEDEVHRSKSGTSDRRHRSESSHRADSGGKHSSSHKGKGSSDHRSRWSQSHQGAESSAKSKSERRSDRRSFTSSRSRSHHRSSSPAKGRSDRHGDKKRHASSDSGKRCSSSRHRSGSDRDSQEKHHKSERKHTRSHHESLSRHRSESGGRNSSDHRSSATKKKHKKSHHRSYTRSRSRSSGHSRSGDRSSRDRSSYDRSSKSSYSRSTSKKKSSSSDHKSRSKYKSGKHSHAKGKSKDRSSSHSKKSKHHHKRSKSSNKSKPSKHSSHKEKSYYTSDSYSKEPKYRSATYSNQNKYYQTSSHSSKRNRSQSHSSVEEKSYRPRSYTPTEKNSYSRYKSESPRHRSTSPGGGSYYQRRLPQYTPQYQYGRTNNTPYMTQSQGRYHNYKRGGWTVHPNFNARNPQRWNSDNNNNRNRIGFYKRPTWNSMNNVRNMYGNQRRYQQQWNPYNNNNNNNSNNNHNYQNRHAPRRWQSPLSLNYSRQYQPRPYSPSWDCFSANGSPRHRSNQRSRSMSTSPLPKRPRKTSPAPASPFRSPAPSPKHRETTPPAKRPHRSRSASPVQQRRSDSECSVKKGSPLPSASPVELQNLRVVVDNMPPAPSEEEDSEQSPGPELPDSESDSSAQPHKAEDAESICSDDDDSESVMSPKIYTTGSVVKGKDVTVDPKASPPKSHSQFLQQQLQNMKNYSSVSEESEGEDDQEAAYTIFDSSEEEENLPVSHRISVSSEESDLEMAAQQSVSDHSDHENLSDVQASTSMYNLSEESDVDIAGPGRTDSSEEDSIQQAAHSISNSSEGEAQLPACGKRAHYLHPEISPPALQTRLLRKKKQAVAVSNVHPSRRAAAAANEMGKMSAVALPVARKRQSCTAVEQADDACSSEDEYWTPAYMEGQPLQHKCSCFLSHTHPSLKKQTKNAWTQTVDKLKVDDDDVDVYNKKKRKQLSGKQVVNSSDASTQTSLRQYKGIQPHHTYIDRGRKPKGKVPPARKGETQRLGSSSSSDNEASSASLSVQRQTTQAKNKAQASPSKSSSRSKMVGKLAATPERRSRKIPHERLSYSTSDMSTPRSSKQPCSEKVQKPCRSGGTASRDSSEEMMGKITREYDNFILDISSVPLPSESQPRKGRTAAAGSSDSCKTGDQRAASGGARTLTEDDDQQKPTIDDFSSLTSQNRILKRAWQSTLSSGHSKKEDPCVASHQPKNPSPSSSSLQISRSQSQQIKTLSVSPGKSLGWKRENQSESSAALSTMEGTFKEAKTKSELAARADKRGKTPISVKMTSKAKPQVLSKKISLSSGSSEEGKKSAINRKRLQSKPVGPSGSKSRHANHRPRRMQDEEEPDEKRIRKSQTNEPAMDNARISGQTRNRALKTSMSGKCPKSSNRMGRQEGDRCAPKERRDEIHTHENAPEQRMGQPRHIKERKETVCETPSQDSTPTRPARHHSTASRLDTSGHDPDSMEEEVCTQKNLHEQKHGKPGTPGKDSNRRPVIKSGAPSRPPRHPDTMDKMEGPRALPKTQEGESEVCQQLLWHKLKMKLGTREEKQATSGTAVGKTPPGKPSRSSGMPGRLHPGRPALKAAQRSGQVQQSAREPILNMSQIKQEEQDPEPPLKTSQMKQERLPEKKRRLALKRKMLEHQCRPGKNLDVSRLEAEEAYQYQTVARVKKVKVGSMAAVGEMTRGQHIKSCIPVRPSTASGIISELVARRYRPKVRESQLCVHADSSELTSDTPTAKRELKGGQKGVKNEASASRSAVADMGSRVGRYRPGRKERQDEGGEHPDMTKMERKQQGNSEYETTNRDSGSDSSDDSETAYKDTINRKSGDDLERKLREKLIRCLEAKRAQTGHDRCRPYQDRSDITHSRSKTFQDKAETTPGKPETVHDGSEMTHSRPAMTHDNHETTHSTTETANDSAETTPDCPEMPGGGPETADDLAETIQDRSEMTQDRPETIHERSEVTHERSEVTHERSEVTQERSEATQDRPSSKAEASPP